MSTTPEDFGAVGDGTTDDTAALQAAIDAGGKCLLGPNTYAFTRLAPKSGDGGSLLVGEGTGATWLKCTDTSAGTAIIRADDGTFTARFGLRDLTVATAMSSVSAAQDTFSDVAGLNLTGVALGDFRNVAIMGFGMGGLILARAEGGAEGFGFTGTTQDGNYHTFSNMQVDACGKYNADQAAIWLKYKANSNRFHATWQKGGGTVNGIVVAHGNDNLFGGATFESVTTGLWLKGASSYDNTLTQGRFEGVTTCAKATGGAEGLVVGYHASTYTTLNGSDSESTLRLIGADRVLTYDDHLTVDAVGKGLRFRSPNGQLWRIAATNSGDPRFIPA